MNSNTYRVVPIITETSTISELIQFVFHSFQDHERLEVEHILVNRENVLKSEIDKLNNDNARLKEELDLAEKKRSVAELEKLKVELEMKEKIEMLRVENEKSILMFARKLKLERKLDKIIGELNDKKKSAEQMEKWNSITISECRQKIKVLEGENVELGEKMGKLIEELNHEKKMSEEKLLIAENEKNQIFSEFSEIIQYLEKENFQMKDEKIKAEEKLLVVEMEKNRSVSDLSEKIKVLAGINEKMLKLKYSKENMAFGGYADAAEKVKKGSDSGSSSVIVDFTGYKLVENEHSSLVKTGPKRKRSFSEDEEEV